MKTTASTFGHWNYRIIKFRYPLAAIKDETELLEIKEVMYDSDGSLMHYTDPQLNGKTVDDLREVYALIAEAFRAPILDEREFK